MRIKLDEYEVIIKENLINEFDNIISNIYSGNKLFIITDDNIYELYKNQVTEALKSFEVEFVVVPHGEHSKSIQTYEQVCRALINKSIRRNHMIIALGGGVIGDLAGFVAGTVLRGIPFIQIPTSLLAMVDSSIGGKTGIDVLEGKNLIGIFNNPKAVLIDTDFLKTLPEEEYRNGLAEVLKAGIIGDKSIIEYIKNNSRLTVKEIVKAINVKKNIVTIDPFEKNERMYLNFGHTFGHAIEIHYNFAMKHGIAVSYGMIIALDEGVKLGITPNKIAKEIKELLLKLKLVKEPFLNKMDYIHLISSDKKQLSDGLRFVFIKEYEQPVIMKGVKFDA